MMFCYHSTAIQQWKLQDYIYSAACEIWLWVLDMMFLHVDDFIKDVKS